MDKLTPDFYHQSEVDVLRHENALLKTLIEETYDPAIVVIDPHDDFHFTFVNQATCRLFQLSKPQLYQRQPWHLNPACNRSRLTKMKTELHRHKSLSYEIYFYPDNAPPRLIHIIANDFVYQDTHKIIAYLRDITDEKQAEQAHRDRELSSQTRLIEKEYKKVFAHMDDNIMLLDVTDDHQLRIADLNQSAKHTLGQHADSCIGSYLESVMPIQNLTQLETLKYQSIHDQTTTHLENIFCYRDSRYYDVTMTPLLDIDGKVKRMVFVKREVTDKILREEERRQRAQEFQMLVENSTDTIVRHDLTGRRIYVNPTFRRLYGHFSASELIKPPKLFPGGKEGEQYQEHIHTVIRTGKPLEFEFHTLVSIEKRCALISLVPEKDSLGNITHILAIGRDITLLKQYRQEQEMAQQQLRRLSAYNEKVRENERKYIAREVHDELGQRLTALKFGMQSLALQLKDNPPILPTLTQLHTHLNETIAFARNLVSRLRPSALDMGMVAALEWLIEDYRHRNPKCHYQLRVSQSEITLDEDIAIALFRLVQESLNNAYKHANATLVTIALNVCDDQLILTVRDNGCGFDPNQTNHHASFGLIGMRERVLAMQAKFALESVLGEGTQIEICIPLIPQEVA